MKLEIVIRLQNFKRGGEWMYTVEQVRVGMQLSKQEFAKKLGMHAMSYDRKVKGKSPWLLDEAVMIAKLSGYDINQIQFMK